jgi:site-specific recombinase XerD
LRDAIAEVEFVELAEIFLLKAKIARSTHKTYVSRHKYFLNFLHAIENGSILAQSLDRTHFQRFYEFNRERGCSDIYAGKILQYVKTVVKYGESICKVEECKISRVAVKIEKKISHTYLSSVELLLVEGVALPQQLTVIRDAFLFCCYTGLEISAISTFNAATDIKTIQGETVLCKARQKTKVERTIPLRKEAIAILQRNNAMFSLPSHQKMNQKLKIVFAHAGIQRPIKWHDSRKTFAYLCLNRWNYSPEVAAALMGHSSTKEIQPYASIQFERIYSEFKKSI